MPRFGEEPFAQDGFYEAFNGSVIERWWRTRLLPTRFHLNGMALPRSDLGFIIRELEPLLITSGYDLPQCDLIQGSPDDRKAVKTTATSAQPSLSRCSPAASGAWRSQ